jgi:hypothetical protein
VQRVSWLPGFAKRKLMDARYAIDYCATAVVQLVAFASVLQVA